MARYPLVSPHVRERSRIDLGHYTPIPTVFLKHPALRRNGRPYYVAIHLLAEILNWYRPIWDEYVDREGQTQIRTWQRFSGEAFRLSYGYFADLFGLSEETVRRAVYFLKERGLVETKTVHIQDESGYMEGRATLIYPAWERIRAILDPAEYADEKTSRDAPQPTERYGHTGREVPQPTERYGHTGRDTPQPTERYGHTGREVPQPTERYDRTGREPAPQPTERYDRTGRDAPQPTERYGHTGRDAPTGTPTGTPTGIPTGTPTGTPTGITVPPNQINKDQNRIPKSKDQNTPPPAAAEAAGSAGSAGNEIERILRDLGVPTRYRRRLADAMARGLVGPTDFAAELARCYADRRVEKPAAAAAVSLLQDNRAAPEFYDPEAWDLPERVWAVLRRAGWVGAPVVEPSPKASRPTETSPGDRVPQQVHLAWRVTAAQMRAYLGSTAYDAWLAHARPQAWSDDELVVAVPHRPRDEEAALEIARRYLAAALGRPVRLRFTEARA